MRTTIHLGPLALLVGLLGAGCSVETASSGEDVGETQAAVVGVDTFLYFRSNASSWGADSGSRLVAYVNPGEWARVVNVNQPWMLFENGGGDSSIVTETNQFNGWGTQQSYLRTVIESLNQHATTPLTPGSTPFKVRYPALGPHRIIVNINSPTIRMEQIICEECPAGTHCEIAPNTITSCVP